MFSVSVTRKAKAEATLYKLQLQDAKDQLAAAKQALIDSGVPQEDIMAGGKTLSKAASGADQIILLLAYLSAQQ